MWTVSLTLFLLSVLLSLSSSQQPPLPPPTQPPTKSTWNVDSRTIYPNPRASPDKCNSPLDSYICDPNKVFTTEEVKEMNDALLTLRQNEDGHCWCGNETICQYTGVPLTIAIMNDFEPDNKQESVMVSYADLISTTWPFQSCQDGIVYVIGAKSKPRAFAHYGSIARAHVSEECRRYFNESFKEDSTPEQLKKAVLLNIQMLRRILNGDNTCSQESSRVVVIVIIIIIVVAIIVATIIAIMLAVKRKKEVEKEMRGAGEGARLNREEGTEMTEKRPKA